jgi:phosphoserine aminotransferase
MTATAPKSLPHGRIHNFSAGPSALPLPVLEQIKEELLHLPGARASVLEISHRSEDFQRVVESAEADLRKLLVIGPEFKVLFLQGGASQMFATVPMNLSSGKKAGYLVTGSWGKKALKEAKTVADAEALWSDEENGFKRVPKPAEVEIPADLAYVHSTSNETIQGVQYKSEIETGDVPLVCDMSSDFLSRPVDMAKYGLIYAGAQKNAGPAGLTVAIVRQDLLERAPEKMPAIFKYATHAENGSLYNTPPAFSIYAAGLVFKWLLETYGSLVKVAEANEKKAALIYDAIDGSGGFYLPHAEGGCRSPMNVTWTLADSKLDAEFLKEAASADLSGLKGHRSVGGMRASIYNAVPRESVEALAAFMNDFREKHL